MFSEVDKEWLSKEKNLNLDICKTCQDTDVPTKIIKEKSYIYISIFYLQGLMHLKFLSPLKQANITLVFMKGEKEWRKRKIWSA